VFVTSARTRPFHSASPKRKHKSVAQRINPPHRTTIIMLRLQEISNNALYSAAPQSHKRSVSEIEDSECAVPKYIKLSSEARVKELEAYIYELHEFSLSKDLASGQ
jgi:hypothetical protein